MCSCRRSASSWCRPVILPPCTDRYSYEVKYMRKNRKMFLDQISEYAVLNGAYQTAFIETKCIGFDKMFREICETKKCGAYGSNWMCPPYIGKIDILISFAKKFERCFIFQTVTKLEDSFDIEGMLEAGRGINDLARKLKNSKLLSNIGDFLILGSGACGYCKECSAKKNIPCVFPDMSISSIEAYGIDAKSLADAGNLNYSNGKNTVTYYGVVLFNDF